MSSQALSQASFYSDDSERTQACKQAKQKKYIDKLQKLQLELTDSLSRNYEVTEFLYWQRKPKKKNKTFELDKNEDDENDYLNQKNSKQSCKKTKSKEIIRIPLTNRTPIKQTQKQVFQDQIQTFVTGNEADMKQKKIKQNVTLSMQAVSLKNLRESNLNERSNKILNRFTIQTKKNSNENDINQLSPIINKSFIISQPLSQERKGKCSGITPKRVRSTEKRQSNRTPSKNKDFNKNGKLILTERAAIQVSTSKKIKQSPSFLSKQKRNNKEFIQLSDKSQNHKRLFANLSSTPLKSRKENFKSNTSGKSKNNVFFKKETLEKLALQSKQRTPTLKLQNCVQQTFIKSVQSAQNKQQTDGNKFPQRKLNSYKKLTYQDQQNNKGTQ